MSCKRPVPSPVGNSGAGIKLDMFIVFGWGRGIQRMRVACPLSHSSSPEGQPEPSRVLPVLILELL